jgi:hypothetical protein
MGTVAITCSAQATANLTFPCAKDKISCINPPVYLRNLRPHYYVLYRILQIHTCTMKHSNNSSKQHIISTMENDSLMTSFYRLPTNFNLWSMVAVRFSAK